MTRSREICRLVLLLALASVATPAIAYEPPAGVDAMGFEDSVRFTADSMSWLSAVCRQAEYSSEDCTGDARSASRAAVEKMLRVAGFGVSRDRARQMLAECTWHEVTEGRRTKGAKKAWNAVMESVGNCVVRRFL